MNELLAPPYKPPTSLEQLLGLVFPEITKMATEPAPPIQLLPEQGKVQSAEDPRLGQAQLEALTTFLPGPVKAGAVPFLSFAKGIKPFGGSLGELASATSNYSRVAGNKMLPIDSLSGGVRMTDPQEAARVNSLVEQMRGPEGYISRLAVDDSGKVLEGQHRLEALRMMGAKKVPVSVIEDLGRGYDTDAAVKALSGLHPDQKSQVVRNALEMVREAGSPEKALLTYELPRGYEKHYRDAFAALMKEVK